MGSKPLLKRDALAILQKVPEVGRIVCVSKLILNIFSRFRTSLLSCSMLSILNRLLFSISASYFLFEREGEPSSFC